MSTNLDKFEIRMKGLINEFAEKHRGGVKDPLRRRKKQLDRMTHDKMEECVNDGLISEPINYTVKQRNGSLKVILDPGFLVEEFGLEDLRLSQYFSKE